MSGAKENKSQTEMNQRDYIGVYKINKWMRACVCVSV